MSRLRTPRCAAATCVGLAFLAVVLNVPSAQADFGFLPGSAGFEAFAGGEAAPDTCRPAEDSGGRLYTSLYYEHEIQVTQNEILITKLTKEDPLDGPCDLAVDSAGHLYVNNFHRNVVRFTPSQYPPNSSTTYGGETLIDSHHSTGVALDPATGALYVDDRTYVAVFEAGQLSVTEPEPAQKIGLGTLVDGRQISFEAGLLHVIDVGDDTEKVYDTSTDPAGLKEVIDLPPPSEGADHQAGSHPYVVRAGFNFNLSGEIPGRPGVPATDGDLRDLVIEEPAGLIENPQALPRCPLGLFSRGRSSPFEESRSGESCPDSSQVGTVELRSSVTGGAVREFGLYNLEPPPGAPSELGFAPFGVPIVFVPQIRQAEGGYGITLVARRVPQSFAIYGLRLNLWGTPWDDSHNGERGNCLNEAEASFPWAKCRVRAETPAEAYLTLPTNCSAPLAFKAAADSWQDPGRFLSSGEPDLSEGAWVKAESAGAPLEGCQELSFAPTARTVPTTDRTTSASGLDFSLEPGETGLLEPSGRAPSQIKQAVVALPQGITINPSVGSGLGVCTPEQYAAEAVTSPPGSDCPNDSKIGDFTLDSPLLEGTLKGSLFLAKPFDNPFGSLLALYLVAKSPERGVLVKVAGQVSADQETGQLTASFDDLPQLPYAHLSIFFREGQRAPLVNPAGCGPYASLISLSPYLNPTAVSAQTSTFQIAHGIGGVGCPSGTPPFAPAAQGGTLNQNAGSYTPFGLHLTRTDAEQEITSYSTVLPPGLLGKIAGVPYCPEADIAAAKNASGVAETEHPSCPAASQIGHTVFGFGLGPVLAYAPGGLYLAGPFHGSSFSVVAIDAATVGPFDLGTIVVRSAIKVDRRSAQVSIDSAGSDPIPHIRQGIPLHLRDIRVYLDKPGFTVNPTSCAPFSLASTLTGSSAPFTDPEDISATPTVPFQVSNCSSLRFEPKLSLHLKGGTKRGDYPSLRGTLTPPPTREAGIASAAVTLPPSEFLAQNHIGTVCTNPQFRQGACPTASVYGHARAITPLLGEALEGPVYLRSSTNSLPDLVAALHAAGTGIDIEVVGRIDSVHGGLRATFEGLPDAPVSKFTMVLFGGRRSLLVNEKNLCAFPQVASARFVAQNNLGEKLKPPVTAHCKKKKARHRKPHHRGHK